VVSGEYIVCHCVLKMFTLRLGLRCEMPIVVGIIMLFIIYCLYIHIILKPVISFAICVLKMFSLWLGLRSEMPIVLGIIMFFIIYRLYVLYI